VFTKRLNRLAIVQTILWTVGMLFMGVTMHIVGLIGAPRRTSYTTYGNHELALTWLSYNQVIALGGVLLFLAILLVLYIWFHLLFLAPKSDKTIEYPIGVVNEQAEHPPRILERWSLWIGVSIALSVIAYAIPMYHMIIDGTPGALPFRSW